MNELVRYQFIAAKGRTMEPRCPEGVGTTRAGQGIVFDQHLPHGLLPSLASRGLWAFGLPLFLSPHPGCSVYTWEQRYRQGPRERVQHSRCSSVGVGGSGVGLQGPLRRPLSRLQREMAQPDQDKHSVLCFMGEGAQWPSCLGVCVRSSL